MNKKLVGIGLCLVMLVSTSAVVSGAWAGRRTIRYNPGTTYGYDVHVPDSMKTNTKKEAAYFGKYITSLNTPQARLVAFKDRGIKLGEFKKLENGSNVRKYAWASNGEKCNVEIKSSWTQNSSCTMDFDFNPDSY